jgi:hypothetical protein
MELQPLPIDQIPASLRRNLEPGAPPPMRMMAARGLVPAPPPDLAVLLFQLSFDPDATVAKSAQDTMAATPAQVLLNVAAAPLPALVLDWIARLFARADDVLEKVLLNQRTDDSTVAAIAAKASESIIELVAANEVRMLRHAPIIESIFLNEHARMSTVDRVIELARRNRMRFENVAVLDHMMEDLRATNEALHRDPAAPGDDAFKTLLKHSLEEEAREEAALAGLSEDQRAEVRTRQNEDLDEGKRASTNKQAEIGKMNISQKVRLATLGSKADRDYLIRDNNRLVHMAAVLSPKVQPPDIIAWSTNKSLPENVIAYIGSNGKYRRSYRIVNNILNNPKAPLRITSSLINSLVVADLTKLMKNRNVSPALQKLAKNLKAQRERGRG